MRVPTLLLLLSGCSLPTTDLDGKACDAAHVCPDGYVCAGAVCRSTQASEDQLFGAASIWNTPIAPTAATATNSAAIMAKLQSLKSDTAGLQLNRDVYTPAVAFADVGVARGPVTGSSTSSGWSLDNVAIPDDAVTGGSANGEILIVDRERNVVWDLAGAVRSGQSFTSQVMGVFHLDGPGLWDPSTSIFSGRESNMCRLGGLIFPEEIAAGFIPHALALSVDPSVIAPTPVAPALTAAGVGSADGVPTGTLLQLEPDYDISGLGAEARVIAQAWKTYGAYVVERGSGIAMYFRSTYNLVGAKPYDGMNLSGIDGTLLRHMRVIAPHASYAYDTAETFNPPMPHQ